MEERRRSKLKSKTCIYITGLHKPGLTERDCTSLDGGGRKRLGTTTRLEFFFSQLRNSVEENVGLIYGMCAMFARQAWSAVYA